MAKAPKASNPATYRSPVRSSVRFVAQDVVLKSFVWTSCKVEIHGQELLDNVDAPFIVIANHSSHLDASLILGSLPRRLSKHIATGAAADYFFDKKLKGLTTSLFFNAYPVERRNATPMRGSGNYKGLTGRLLEEGIPLLIFPEGTRSRTGALGPFKPGVAALSISKGVPCLPMALVGAYAAWPYDRSVPPTNHPSIHVVIGHPLTAHPGEDAQGFADRMRSVIAEMYNSTARAYGMYTLDDYARKDALKQAEDAQWLSDHGDDAIPSDPGQALGQETPAEKKPSLIRRATTKVKKLGRTSR
ncbi:MAG: 1-acyl-sn-glycerol-3-phosphate acyltransferase [Propionibacteriaceae bacterium]|nr:1-acyl-sn-glycerol-3-phosphate acyltransferase [Propionibacteriaceae bacterium]